MEQTTNVINQPNRNVSLGISNEEFTQFLATCDKLKQSQAVIQPVFPPVVAIKPTPVTEVLPNVEETVDPVTKIIDGAPKDWHVEVNVLPVEEVADKPVEVPLTPRVKALKKFIKDNDNFIGCFRVKLKNRIKKGVKVRQIYDVTALLVICGILGLNNVISTTTLNILLQSMGLPSNIG